MLAAAVRVPLVSGYLCAAATYDSGSAARMIGVAVRHQYAPQFTRLSADALDVPENAAGGPRHAGVNQGQVFVFYQIDAREMSARNGMDAWNNLQLTCSLRKTCRGYSYYHLSACAPICGRVWNADG